METYCICWTRRDGSVAKSAPNSDLAGLKIYAALLNKEYPELCHRVVNCESRPITDETIEHLGGIKTAPLQTY